MHSVRQFELIRALDRHRHFGRAAAELGVSQPALTRSLQAIEDELGVRLFDREGSVRPTVFGDVLLARGQEIVGAFSDAMREIAMLRGLETGELTVGAGIYPADICVAAAIGRIVTLHPRLLVTFDVKRWPEVQTDVLEGHADIGVADISEATRHPDLDVEPIRESVLSFFCRSGHPLLERGPVTLADLMEFPWVGPQVTSPMRVHVPSQDKAFGVHEPEHDRLRPRVLVQTFPAAKAVLMAGDGLSAALPSQIREELAKGTCALIPIDTPWLKISYGFITRKGRTLSPATKLFKDMVRAVEAEIDGR